MNKNILFLALFLSSTIISAAKKFEMSNRFEEPQRDTTDATRSNKPKRFRVQQLNVADLVEELKRSNAGIKEHKKEIISLTATIAEQEKLIADQTAENNKLIARNCQFSKRYAVAALSGFCMGVGVAGWLHNRRKK